MCSFFMLIIFASSKISHDIDDWTQVSSHYIRDYTWLACAVVGYSVYLSLHVIPISGKHHGYLSCLFWCYMVEKYYCKGLFPGTLVKFHEFVMAYWIRIYTVVLLLLGKKMVKNTDVMRWLYTHIYKQPKSWAIWNNCNYQKYQNLNFNEMYTICQWCSRMSGSTFFYRSIWQGCSAKNITRRWRQIPLWVFSSSHREVPGARGCGEHGATRLTVCVLCTAELRGYSYRCHRGWRSWRGNVLYWYGNFLSGHCYSKAFWVDVQEFP